MPKPVSFPTISSKVGGTTPRSGPPAGDKALKKACEDFESLLLHQMLKQMRRTVPKTGLFHGGAAEQIYHGLLDGEIAKQISHRKGVGLAPLIYRQVKSLREHGEEISEETLKSAARMPID